MKKQYKIYILQMHTNTVPSKVIKVFTGYEYSHVAIALDRNCDTIYSFGRKRVDPFLDSGFVIEHKTGEFFKKFKDSNCRIYELEVTKKKYKKLKKSLERMIKYNNVYKYDFIGLVFRFFNIPIKFHNKFVCSYFVAHILSENNICKFDKKTYFIKPEDFDKITGIREIYKGKYLLYNVA